MRFAVLVCLSACGFRPTAGVLDRDAQLADGSVDVQGQSDAPPVATNCLANWFGTSLHFGSPSKLTTVSTGSEERDPSLSEDELQIWFESDRGGTGTVGAQDVWTATRSSIAAPFGTPSPYNVVNSTQNDGKFTLSDDGLTYLISSDRTGSEGDYDLFVAHRATTSGAFPAASNTLLANVNDGNGQYDPWVNSDGTEVFYAPVNGGQRIYRATRADATSGFSAGAIVSALDVGSPVADPTLFDGERVIVFSSTRSDNVGGGSSDLWFATRPDTASAFSAPKHLPDVNSTNPDGDPWVSPDGCRLYFAMQSGSYDLYEADVE